MDLTIRPLEKYDNVEQIFNLCKQNNLTAKHYATNYKVWNLQYVNNPLKKSWNSVLIDKDDNTIHGHIGLSPQIIRAFSLDWTAGLINNGVISNNSRNKLLPFNNTKTFAITPLIDCCVQESFKDNVDFSIANSIIHPLIWRTVKYSSIDVERKSTIHTDLKGLFKGYINLFRSIYKSSYIRFFALPYSILLIFLQLFVKKVRILSGFFVENNNQDIEIDRISHFSQEFDVFFNEFYNANLKIITCKRDIDFLNWKFQNNHFRSYAFRIKNKLIGFVILEKKLNNDKVVLYTVMDCIILNDYLSYTKSIFKKLYKVEKVPIEYMHYISCVYTKQIFMQCLKQGFFYSLNPFCIVGIDKRKRHITTTLYYKINEKAKITHIQKESIDQSCWFITPILFYPGGNYDEA